MKELSSLIEKLKTERDAIHLNLHLASMEVKEEFEKAEQHWQTIKNTGIEEATDISDDLLAKAKIVSEELKETYQRIATRISE